MSLLQLPRHPLVSMNVQGLDLLTFTARKEAPKAGEDWFRIVKAKKGSNVTKVYIYDEIGYWGTNAKDFAAQLSEIETSEIHLHVNSPGGSVFDGLAIMETIRNHDATVTAYVDGLAASAASYLIQSADHRVIGQNAQMMIHDAAAYAGGNAEAFRKAAQLLDKISDNIADIYSKATGASKSKAEFRSIMKETKWYDAEEALAEGLVDEVTDSSDEDAEDAAKNKWDLSAIENMVRQQGNTPPPSLATLNTLTINNTQENPMNQPAVPTTPAQPAAPATPAAPAQPTTAQAAVSLVINGQMVTDPVAIQTHITALETFKDETIKGGRVDFVKALAEGPKPKIAATAIESLTEFAQTLSNEQFTKWKASYDAAPAMSLTAPHGTTGSGGTEPQNGGVNSSAAEALEIKDLEQIVADHRSTGMSEESLKTKASYKRLQELKANQASAS